MSSDVQRAPNCPPDLDRTIGPDGIIRPDPHEWHPPLDPNPPHAMIRDQPCPNLVTWRIIEFYRKGLHRPDGPVEVPPIGVCDDCLNSVDAQFYERIPDVGSKVKTVWDLKRDPSIEEILHWCEDRMTIADPPGRRDSVSIMRALETVTRTVKDLADGVAKLELLSVKPKRAPAKRTAKPKVEDGEKPKRTTRKKAADETVQ